MLKNLFGAYIQVVGKGYLSVKGKKCWGRVLFARKSKETHLLFNTELQDRPLIIFLVTAPGSFSSNKLNC
jgi:hypothetical protein